MKKVIIVAGLTGAALIANYAYRSTKQIDVDKKELVHLKPGQKDFQHTLDSILKDYKGEEKVKMLTNLSTDLLPDERKLFLSALSENLKKEDLEVSYQIASSLKDMKLKKDEIISLAHDSCHFLADKNYAQKFIDSYKALTLDLAAECK